MIPGDVLKFNDVTLSAQYAFTPVPETVKPRYEARGEQFVIVLDKPENLEDWKEARFVAYVLDCESGEVQNACDISIDEGISTLGITDIAADGVATLSLKPTTGKGLEVTSLTGGPVEIAAYSPDGITLTTLELTLDPGETRRVTLDLPSGLSLVKATSAAETAVCRIIR